MDFTTGSIPKKLLKFMVPIFLALVLQAMYSAVDLLVVGKYGSEAGISAVSSGSEMIACITFLVASLTTGLTVLMGQYIGAKKTDRLSPAVGGAVCFFSVFALALSVCLVLFAKPFSVALQAPEQALDLTVQYVQICGGGMLFVVAYNLLGGIFRGLGNSRLPLLFVGIACVCNIGLDFLFVAVLHWDVAGAALATVLAQAISVILSLLLLTKMKNLPFSLHRKDIRFNREILRFLKLGAPMALQETVVNLSFLVLCGIANSLGLEASSGYGVACRLTQFIMLAPSALMQSESTFVAQNVGAMQPKRAVSAMKWGMVMGLILGVPTFLLVFFRGDLPSSVFTDNPQYIAQSWAYLKGFGADCILTCILFPLVGYFAGNGRTVFDMVQSLIQTLGVRLPLSFVMASLAGTNLTKIGIASPTATLLGILLCVIYYNRMQKKRT